MFPKALVGSLAIRPWMVRSNRTLFAVAILFAVVSCNAPASGQNLRWQSGAADESQPKRVTGELPAVSQAAFVEPATPKASAGEVTPTGFIQPVAPRAKRPATVKPAVRRAAATTQPKRPAPSEAAMPVQRAVAAVAKSDFASSVQRAMGRGESSSVEPAGFFGGCGDPACGCAVGLGCPFEPGCAFAEPGCGFMEPGCGCVEPGCGCVEPGCGCVEPGCGCAPPVYYDEPGCEAPCVEGAPCAETLCGDPVCGDCVCGDVGCCGECVGPCPTCPPCLGGCYERGAIPICIWLPPIKEIVIFGGVQGFKSPLDYNPLQRDGGNFGFNEGLNIGGRMSWLPVHNMGFQIGYRATQNQLSGDVPTGMDSHSQSFFTTGLFQRSAIGWQYGFVYDLLQDERQASTDFSQVRGLWSFTNHAGGEVGFEFAVGTSEQMIGAFTFEPADQYKLFWRYHGKTGGEFRSQIGISGDSHVILGADLQAPLNHQWSIQTGFTYFIPTDAGNGLAGGAAAASPNATEEAWNVGLNLVWHWGGTGKRWYRSPWRPLFDVADNGSLVIDDID